MVGAYADAADPSGRAEFEHVMDIELQRVRVHRVPRYGRVLWSGILGGLVAALAMTVIAAASGYGATQIGAAGTLRVFTVFGIVTVGLGLLVAGITVILMDRWSGHHSARTTATHEITLVDDLTSPVGDDPPDQTRPDLPPR